MGSFLIQACSFGYVFASGVFQYHYKEIMLPEYSSQQLGWITTIAEFMMLGGGVAIGHLIDKYGHRVVMAPFALIGVLAILLLSFCREYWQVLLTQGFLFGLAGSGTTLPSIVCVTQWFSTRKGLAVGLASAGSSVGGIFFPIMITSLLSSKGFAAAVRWSALVIGCCMAIGVVCCSGPFSPRTAKNKQAEHSSGSESLPTHTVDPVDSPARHSRWAALRHNGWAWAAFCVGACLYMSTLMVPFNYMPLMAARSGMDPKLAQYTVAITNAGSTLGRVVPGFLSDHLGQFNVMIMVTTASAIAILAVWLPLEFRPSDAGIVFFSAFYGFVSGGYVSLLSPCVVSLVDGRLEDLGMKFGIACGFVSIGGLVGVPLVGALRDSTDSFVGPIGLAGALTVASVVSMIGARAKLGGWKVCKKV